MGTRRRCGERAQELTGFRYRLHIDLDHEEYAASRSELVQLSTAGSSIAKGFCLVAGPISVATGLNAVGEIVGMEAFEWSLTLFLNSVFAIASFLAAAAFGFAWRHADSTKADLLRRILARTPVDLAPIPQEEPRRSTSRPAEETHETRLGDGPVRIESVQARLRA